MGTTPINHCLCRSTISRFVLCLALWLPAAPTRAQDASSVQSPAIQSLTQRRSSGDVEAVQGFWTAVSKHGSPLIEPDPAAPQYSLVTFVWRGDKDTKNVVAVTPLTLINFADAVMRNVPNTDVWYKTYRMRNDARMTYRFAVNDTLIPFDQDKNVFARMKTWQIDPNNPRQFDVGMNITASVLQLPMAPDDKWTIESPAVAKGVVAKLDFHSDLLANQRPVWIYRPPRYSTGKTYPLLIFMDGESYTSLVPVPTILDNLIAAKAIPPVIAVLVGNGSGDARETEMNCNRSWSDSLVKELLPWLKTDQGVSFAPASILVIGDSLAGLAAACAAHDYPKVFGKVISQSGSYYRAPAGEEPEWLARHLATEAPIPVQFYLEIGLLETAPIPNRDPSMLTANRHLRDVLLAKSNHVRYVEHFSGHEHVSWRANLPEALIFMLNER